MINEWSGRPDEPSTIVVSNSLAARQWEMLLAAHRLHSNAAAWVTPAIVTYANWLENLWLATDDAPSVPLTAAQSRALWRRVVAESAEGDELIGHAGVAEWAASAWELLHRWHIDPERQRAGSGQRDYQALLAWCRAYRAQLDTHGWVDRAQLELRLAAHPRIRLTDTAVIADLDESYPSRTALFERLLAAGLSIEQRAAPEVVGRQRRARLADSAEELRAALKWAEQRVAKNKDARVAVVVAGLSTRSTEVGRLLAARFAEKDQCPVWNGSQRLLAEPTIGAALTALALLAPSARYGTFGRWLRSPFFLPGSNEQAARAKLDAKLRTDLRAQLPFRTAYAQAGLADRLQREAPQAAAALAAGLGDIGTLQRATPSRWAHLWTRFLTQLAWQPPAAEAMLQGWQTSLDELAHLSPVLGEITIDAALFELERVLDRPSPAAMPLRGVHLLERVEDVGPGYDAVWATGFTDTYWPEAPQGNPLLPRALQRTHEMPRASPQQARDRSARHLERLVNRTEDLVVSWPGRVYDYETEPSPAIREWPLLPPVELATLTASRSRETLPPRETVKDPPPPVMEERLRGGAGMLGRQARCPLYAFCCDRLGARPLEALGFGVPKRLRGIAVHRAIEGLLIDLPSNSELAAASTAAIERSATKALASVFGQARRPLQALFELELEQLLGLLGAWLSSERERSPFRVLAVEQRREVALGRWSLQVRLDRLDRLSDGSIAIIDYKTGERATSADWFTPRLRDAQVPLYAIQSPEGVGAAVIARLRPGATSYSGLWREAVFPGRPSNRGTPDWDSLLASWRAQLEQLAGEFASGDTRVFADQLEDVSGAYAPLTRIAEQLGLVRGSVPNW